MFRRMVMVAPNDPYEYVVYNSLDKDESCLEHKLSFHRLCSLLRRYDNVDGYTVEYWNKLFSYFCKQGDFKEDFSSIEQINNNLSLEACVERLSDTK